VGHGEAHPVEDAVKDGRAGSVARARAKNRCPPLLLLPLKQARPDLSADSRADIVRAHHVRRPPREARPKDRLGGHTKLGQDGLPEDGGRPDRAVRQRRLRADEVGPALVGVRLENGELARELGERGLPAAKRAKGREGLRAGAPGDLVQRGLHRREIDVVQPADAIASGRRERIGGLQRGAAARKARA